MARGFSNTSGSGRTTESGRYSAAEVTADFQRPKADTAGGIKVDEFKRLNKEALQSVLYGDAFKNDINDPDSLASFEAQIPDKAIEYGVAYLPSGEKLFNEVGRSGSVPISAESAKKMIAAKNAVFSHNHPSGASLSDGDFVCFAGFDLSEMRAVGDNYVYSISDPIGAFRYLTQGFLNRNGTHYKPKLGWSKLSIRKKLGADNNWKNPKYLSAKETAKPIADAIVADRRKREEVSDAMADRILWQETYHIMVSNFCEKYGLVYKRTPLKYTA